MTRSPRCLARVERVFALPRLVPCPRKFHPTLPVQGEPLNVHRKGLAVRFQWRMKRAIRSARAS